MTALVDTKAEENFLAPPGYSREKPQPDEVDFGAMTPTTNGSNASLPTYDAIDASSSSSVSGFQPTRQLQIQAKGCSSRTLTGHSMDPIFVYEIGPDGQHGNEAYVSLRYKRTSNNSNLIRAGDSTETPLCSTTYRIGPFRPPRLNLAGWNEEVTVQASNWGCLSRKTTIKTPIGDFRWRYGGRKERHAENASNLLVLEQMDGSNPDSKNAYRRVGHMIRNKELRSEGTSRWTSGNGGRLMLDLRPWADTKGVAQQLEVLAVASCLVMLKKEVDNTYDGIASASSTSSVAVVS